MRHIYVSSFAFLCIFVFASTALASPVSLMQYQEGIAYPAGSLVYLKNSTCLYLALVNTSKPINGTTANEFNPNSDWRQIGPCSDSSNILNRISFSANPVLPGATGGAGCSTLEQNASTVSYTWIDDATAGNGIGCVFSGVLSLSGVNSVFFKVIFPPGYDLSGTNSTAYGTGAYTDDFLGFCSNLTVFMLGGCSKPNSADTSDYAFDVSRDSALTDIITDCYHTVGVSVTGIFNLCGLVATPTNSVYIRVRATTNNPNKKPFTLMFWNWNVKLWRGW
jgi:hypothetical protein